MKKLIIFILMAIISNPSFGQSPVKTKKVNVNGIDLYFKVSGHGDPLLLLHGWTQSSEFWSEYIDSYAKHFTVYAIDLRGHGRTSEVTQDFTIEKSALDILGLMDYFQLKNVKAIGLSYGGLTLLRLAGLHPRRIEEMILIGVSQQYDGKDNSNYDPNFSYENLPASIRKELNEIHHRGENQIRALFNPDLNYNIEMSDEEIKAIKTKSMIVQGDRDEILGVGPALALYRNLPNSELWIVPNAGHIPITGLHHESFIKTSLHFFNN